MKVSNMTNSRGNSVPNQFIITGTMKRLSYKKYSRIIDGTMFQSYDSNIAFIADFRNDNTVFLDKNYWDYSATTGKYRNQFLNETKKETQAKIDSGVYKLVDLN